MHFLIKLGFVGAYKADILYYFANILTRLNKRVLVIDASHEQTFKYSIPNMMSDEETNFRGIQYVFDKRTIDTLSKIDYMPYDIVLIDYGFNSEVREDWYQCNIMFVITDYQKHHLIKLKQLLEYKIDNIKFVKIYRDVVNCKINKKYTNYFLNIEDQAEVLEEYVLDLTEQDKVNQLLFQHDLFFSYKKLSKSYKNLFVDIISEFYTFKEQDIKRGIHHIEEGDMNATGILEYSSWSNRYNV